MPLHTLQITNCFGFRDTDPIKLYDPGNLIYILGKNSSGKTALLTAIGALSPAQTPHDDQRFENFKPSSDIPALIARFANTNQSFDLPSFVGEVDGALREANASSPEVLSSAEFHALVESIKSALSSAYATTINDLRVAPDIWVKRSSFGDYTISTDPTYKDVSQRQQMAGREINEAFRKIGGTFTSDATMLPIGGASRRVGLLTPQQIDNLLFRQFPRIVRFDQRVMLSENLPDIIMPKDFGSDSAVLGAFLDVLGRDTVSRALAMPEPRERRRLIDEMQARVEAVSVVVNNVARSFGHGDLLNLTLGRVCTCVID